MFGSAYDAEVSPFYAPIPTFWDSDAEVSEAQLTAFELPAAPAASTVAEKDALQHSILCRTVVAAARGGKLQRLDPPFQWLQKPFAVRALLPIWIGVRFPQDVGIAPDHTHWRDAIRSLRKGMRHAALWRDVSGNEPRQSPLSLVEVQTLRAYFTAEADRTDSWEFKAKVLYLFLPWLEEDAGLAQRVLDAWNAAVQRGIVGGCTCERCGKWRRAVEDERRKKFRASRGLFVSSTS